MNITLKKKWLLSIVFVLIGAILGYIYYLKVGCISGACIITSNPYISALYGSVIGFLISTAFDIKDTKDDDNHNA